MHKTDFLKVTESIAGYIEIRAVGNVNFNNVLRARATCIFLYGGVGYVRDPSMRDAKIQHNPSIGIATIKTGLNRSSFRAELQCQLFLPL